MLNEIILAGRLVRDPELRYTENQTPVCSFTLAVDREWNKSGDTATDFIPCVAWRGGAEYVERNFIKGELMILVGRLTMRKYTDKDGNNRTAAEVSVHNAYKTEFTKKKQTFVEVEEEGDLPF